MKAFFTVEAIFALLLLPFLFYFVAGQSGSAPQEKLLVAHQIDFLHDVLDSLDRGGRLNEVGVSEVIQQLKPQHDLCYKIDKTDKCTSARFCVWRTFLDDGGFHRIYLCMEAET